VVKKILFWRTVLEIRVHSLDEPASPISFGNYLFALLQGVVKKIPFWK